MVLELREYGKEDLERHLELNIMNGVYEEINEEIRRKKEKWIEQAIENYSKDRPDFYTLVIALDGEMIGNIIAEKIDYENRTLEIGYWIGKKYWNKGYTTRALKLFLEKIKKRFDPKKVLSHTPKNNKASQRVLEKVGFTDEGEDEEGKKIYSKSLE